MLIKSIRASDAKPSEITPKSVYMDRRRFLQTAAAGAALASFANGPAGAAKIDGIKKWPGSLTSEKLTPLDSIASYNNFYEFGTDKSDPVRNARFFMPRPWTVAIGGEVAKPATVDLDALLKPHTPEERIYRMRCVEAWSMVIPWVGIPLADVLKRFEPTSKAKFVAFETLNDPKRMPGQAVPSLQWPYVEGLRIDEAMHPLTLLAVGIYDEDMPNQNGAPLRLVVPWKYGFKGIKSIVKISLVEKQPPTSWNIAAPNEYGFFSNVNPKVDHQRWSQAKERRSGEFLRRDTLMFNGYGDEVASMYTGLDLKANY
ncbi:MAG: protein-methionine-sulfoxide reductase catalytic subunit MsrP [Rhodospirillales bacterium]|nr:protein-methionine-sulfoxide reductase catalytic subunit MsrP [Rhodospirillales bacterium]